MDDEGVRTGYVFQFFTVLVQDFVRGLVASVDDDVEVIKLGIAVVGQNRVQVGLAAFAQVRQHGAEQLAHVRGERYDIVFVVHIFH